MCTKLNTVIIWDNQFYVPEKFLYKSVKRVLDTAKKAKFSIKDFFSKCDQVRRKLRIWLHLLKKSLMENFTLCAVQVIQKIPHKLPNMSFPPRCLLNKVTTWRIENSYCNHFTNHLFLLCTVWDQANELSITKIDSRFYKLLPKFLLNHWSLNRGNSLLAAHVF